MGAWGNRAGGILRGAILACCVAATVHAQTPGNTLQLEPYKVTGRRAAASDDPSANPTDRFTSADVTNTGAFDLGEFLTQLPPSPNGNDVLILIDGHPTHLKASELPPELIEGIEVSRYGALPKYGAYANGNVINVRLKKNYRGAKLGFNDREPFFSGGGAQHGVNLAGAAKRGKLQLIYTVSGTERMALRASARPFSANQDHSFNGGQDLRLLWGLVPVVQSASGPLNGIVDAQGQPSAIAIASTLPAVGPGDFVPGRPVSPTNLITAAGQERYNTAESLYLISPSRTWDVNLHLTYPLTRSTELTVSGNVGHTSSENSAAPPVTPVSAATLIPAAYNPIGQDIEVGFVHGGFGRVRTFTSGDKAEFGFNLSGSLPGSWRWESDAGVNWTSNDSHARDLDPQKFSASLSNPDPTKRFNPFGDPTANIALYPLLAVTRSSESSATTYNFQGSVRGDVGRLPAGPATLQMRVSGNSTDSERSYRNARDLADASYRDSAGSYGLSANMEIPLVGPANQRPGIYRLATETASRANGGTDRGITYDERFGITWAPIRPLSLRASVNLGLVAPTHYIARVQPLLAATLTDPRRTPATASDVQIISRDFQGTHSAHTDQEILGATFEPPALPGFQLSITYDRRHSGNVTGTPFNAQDLIDNESALPGRVTRLAPTAADLALNQPGAITAIDITPVEGGDQERSGLNFAAVFKLETADRGKFSFSTTVRHELSSRFAFDSFGDFASVSNSQFTPPPWALQSQFTWSGGGWNAVTQFRYSEEISGAVRIPSFTDLDLLIGYRFRSAILGHWGQGTQIAFGLAGLLEGPPPFADTIEGFRGGLPLGRTYSLKLSLPL